MAILLDTHTLVWTVLNDPRFDDTILQAQLIGLHKDPADRLLVAVSINAGFRLLTADEKILAWSGKLDRIDCRD